MTRTIDYIEGFRNAAKRASSFLLMKANHLNDPASKITASVLAVDLDIHMYDHCDPNNPEAKTDPAVNPPDATPPKDMSEALLQIWQLQTERDAALKICSESANSYRLLVDLIEERIPRNGFNSPFIDVIIKECITKARELSLVGNGKMDSVAYEDGLSVAKFRIHDLRRQLEDNLKAMQSASEAMKNHAAVNETTTEAMTQLSNAIAEVEDELNDLGV